MKRIDINMKKTILHEKVYYYEDTIENFDEVIQTIAELAEDNNPEGIKLWNTWTASDDKDTIYGENQNFDIDIIDKKYIKFILILTFVFGCDYYVSFFFFFFFFNLHFFVLIIYLFIYFVLIYSH